jgi:hypothetical protein
VCAIRTTFETLSAGWPSGAPAAKQFAEKVETPSFRSRRTFSVNRGTLHAEESLFSWASNKEGFLASLGMTIRGTFSAACEAVTYKDIQVAAQALRASEE